MTSGIGYAGRNITICADKIPESQSNDVYISSNLAAKWAWAALLSLCAPELLCFVPAMLGNAVCLIPAIFGALSRRPNRWFVVLMVIDLCAIAAQSSSYWFWPAVVPSIRSNIVAICGCVLLISCGWWQNFVSPKSFLPPVRGLAAFSGRLAEKRSKTYVLVSLWKCFLYTFCLFFFLTPTIPLHDLLQRNPFGEKLITITARDLNQSQITNFLQRMHEYETPDYRVSSRKDEEEDEEDQTPTKTSKRPWDPDNSENAIDAGDYETSQSNTKTEKKTQESTEKSSKKKKSRAEEEQEASKKHRRFKRSRRSRQTDEEDEIISAYNVYDDYVELNQFTTPYDALWVALIQVLMQRTGFALPVFLVVPATVIFLTDACASRAVDPCFMKKYFGSVKPEEHIFGVGVFGFNHRHGFGLAGCLFTRGVTVFFVDQNLAFNRRRDDKVKILTEDIDLDTEDTSETYETIGMSGIVSKPPPSVRSVASSRLDSGLIRDSASAADEITKIYACATLWHESALVS
ncbi:hypothetical protein M3Y98_00553700 [Aphelenchoides besseyi]|nr:hypothetical protein M3Y98_00553700 [Aphelenchoides besseyi]